MRDYLISISAADLAANAEAISQWATPVLDGEGNVIDLDVQLPPLDGHLKISAFTDLGTPPDENGENGIAPTEATGLWFILSIGSGNPLPEVVAPFVVAEGNREDGLTLPDGIVGLAPIGAGMTTL